MHIKNKKGQSTVEYILLVTAVVAVLIIFTNASTSPFKTQLNSTLGTVTNDMNLMSGRISGSYGN